MTLEKIDFKTYGDLAIRTAPYLGSSENNILHAKAGLKTEYGELLDIFKRWFAYNKPVDIVHLKEELGDILWYYNLLERSNNISSVTSSFPNITVKKVLNLSVD